LFFVIAEAIGKYSLKWSVYNYLDLEVEVKITWISAKLTLLSL
jgi:hypothetical protein